MNDCFNCLQIYTKIYHKSIIFKKAWLFKTTDAKKHIIFCCLAYIYGYKSQSNISNVMFFPTSSAVSPSADTEHGA